jgi:hypothetical protein
MSPLELSRELLAPARTTIPAPVTEFVAVLVQPQSDNVIKPVDGVEGVTIHGFDPEFTVERLRVIVAVLSVTFISPVIVFIFAVKLEVPD